MPPYKKVSIEPETARADSQLPLDYGLKDSSDDRDDFRAVCGGPHLLTVARLRRRVMAVS